MDESLFGESRAKKTAARRRAGRSLMGGQQQRQKPDFLTLSRGEYEEIKRRANTPLATSQTVQTGRKKEHRVKINHIHKKRPTAEEEYERQYREQVGIGGANIRAFRLRNEELDEVKELKTHLEIMRVKAELDGNMRVKQQQKQAIESYERRKDEEMEKLRIQGLRQDADKQVNRRQAAKAAQQDLLSQIQRNKEMQLLEEERLAQENVQMRRHLEILEEKELQKKRVAQAAQARRNVELAKANQLAEKYRIMEREQEEKEDKEISQYLHKKAAREEYRLRQREKLKQEEELAMARMREMQERHSDKQAENDEKRAITYHEQRQLKEEADMANRERERFEAQQEVLRELEHQKNMKAKNAILQKEQDDQFAMRLQREAMQANRKRDDIMERKQREREQYKKDLINLIERRDHESKESQRMQREKDQHEALEGEVYKHRVKLVIAEKLKEHGKQYPVPAKYAESTKQARMQRQKANIKFHKTRALW